MLIEYKLKYKIFSFNLNNSFFKKFPSKINNYKINKDNYLNRIF